MEEVSEAFTMLVSGKLPVCHVIGGVFSRISALEEKRDSDSDAPEGI